ncbi:MAG: hypothetical protein JWN98_1473, partial [Abditibacteriota bacterium]|nr:hypothetical protein [Abditibacteriota bacterium]
MEADSAPDLPLGFASLPVLLAFGALCLLLIVSPVQLSGFWVVDNDYVPQALLLGIAACVCLALALAPKVRGLNATLFTPKSIGFWLALFFGWSCLSLATSVYHHDSLLEISRLAVALIWFPIAHRLLSSRDQSTSMRRATWLMGAITAGAVLVSLIALYSYTQEPTRQFATFYNPNLFANYNAMTLPLCLAWALLLRRSTNPLWWLVGGVAFILILGGLLVSYSKGGLLAAFIGLLVFTVAIAVARGQALRKVLWARRQWAAIGALLFIFGGGALFGKTVLPRLQAARSSD